MSKVASSVNHIQSYIQFHASLKRLLHGPIVTLILSCFNNFIYPSSVPEIYMAQILHASLFHSQVSQDIPSKEEDRTYGTSPAKKNTRAPSPRIYKGAPPPLFHLMRQR